MTYLNAFPLGRTGGGAGGNRSIPATHANTTDNVPVQPPQLHHNSTLRYLALQRRTFGEGGGGKAFTLATTTDHSELGQAANLCTHLVLHHQLGRSGPCRRVPRSFFTPRTCPCTHTWHNGQSQQPHTRIRESNNALAHPPHIQLKSNLLRPHVLCTCNRQFDLSIRVHARPVRCCPNLRSVMRHLVICVASALHARGLLAFACEH